MIIKRYSAMLTALLISVSVLAGCSSKTEQLEADGYISSLEISSTIDYVDTAYIKSPQHANPISSEIFCADPTAIEYNGRLYVFGTNDHQQFDLVEEGGNNYYGLIKSLVVFSTEDMANWTYHGIIDVGAIAPWIYNSWAPSIVSRVEDDGLTHFYLYFSDGGMGVGVLTATDPLGPWSDPLGKPLINASTPGLYDCAIPFDPGVCIDDNGDAWIAFGGGRAYYGTNYLPGTARIAMLGEDMVSLGSEIKDINAPYFFEASELNYINGTYVYTYNTTWDERDEWHSDKPMPTHCSMAYMTTKTPLDTDSWEYQGYYLPNPGESGMEYGNSHTHLHKYRDRYYLFHQTQQRQSALGLSGGFRSIGVVEATVDESTLSIPITHATREGVTQISYGDPSALNEAECFSTCTGIGYIYDSNKLVTGIKSNEKGANILCRQHSFNIDTSEYFLATVSGKGCIEVRLDAPDGECAAAIEFDLSYPTGVYTALPEGISGAHDVYFVFSGSDIEFYDWQFL